MTVSFQDIELTAKSRATPKFLRFNWVLNDPDNQVSGIGLEQNPDGVSGYSGEGLPADIPANVVWADVEHALHLTQWDKVRYQLVAQDGNGASLTRSDETSVPTTLIKDLVGYFKAEKPGKSDFFGTAMAVSADGNILAVGAPGEDSAATGTDGDMADNSLPYSGAIYIFERSDLGWAQRHYIKAAVTHGADKFGSSVALSDDGNTLAVGAPQESSSTTGINGDPNNEDATGSGAVYVFTYDGSNWIQQAYIKASNTDSLDRFGAQVALSGDGNRLAVGAPHEGSASTGIDGDQSDNTNYDSGAVYTYTRMDGQWSQESYIKASNSGGFDQFGKSLALSNDGLTLVAGASSERSLASGVNGDQSDDSGNATVGAAYVFHKTATSWEQQAYLKASNPGNDDYFGNAVAISSAGDRIAVGAYGESSSSLEVNGDQSLNNAYQSGAVYLFDRTDSSWAQSAYIKAMDANAGDQFGTSVALSDDGNILVAGSPNEYSNSDTINQGQDNRDAAQSGAAYSYVRTDSGEWIPRNFIKASNSDAFDHFGKALILSSNGRVLAIGAAEEDGGSGLIGENQSYNDADDAGAVYLY